MQNNVLIAICVCFGFAILGFSSFFIWFRSKGRGIAEGPFGIKIKVDGTNEKSSGAEVTDASSRSGGLTISDQTGRGAQAHRIEVEGDISVSSVMPPEKHPQKS